jgi:acyl phosphate:glycerol-3-phosphate acyltransferase
MAFLLFALILAYLIGSIPSGYLIARMIQGIDIRQYGSKNIGATNVGRVIGWKWFPLVFLMDFAKGAAPVAWIGYDALGTNWGGLQPVDAAALCGLAAMVGHMFPIYLGFRGGKGVATGAGVVLFLVPVPGLIAVGCFLVFLALTRIVSLGAILAAVGLMAGRLALTWPESFSPENVMVTCFCLLGGLLVMVRHRHNIARLRHGTEPRLGRRASAKSALPPPPARPSESSP